MTIPSYNGSYTRSLEAVESYLEEHPDIAVVIDLHRDALVGSDGTVYKTVADIDGTQCAQVMLVAGTNFSGLTHDDWQKNLSFALKIQYAMVEQYPTLARPAEYLSKQVQSARHHRFADSRSWL